MPSRKARSTIAASFSRIVTGWCDLLSTQPFSQRAGHTRPVNSGKSLVWVRMVYAPRMSFLKRRSCHSGGRLPVGQLQWQKGTPHSMQRDACRRRSSGLSVCSTSPKSFILSLIGRYPASFLSMLKNAVGLPIILCYC